MKIIKEGKIAEISAIYKGTCTNCGCVIECEEEELKRKYHTYGMGVMERDEITHYVVCPTNGCFNHILPKIKVFQ